MRQATTLWQDPPACTFESITLSLPPTRLLSFSLAPSRSCSIRKSQAPRERTVLFRCRQRGRRRSHAAVAATRPTSFGETLRASEIPECAPRARAIDDGVGEDVTATLRATYAAHLHLHLHLHYYHYRSGLFARPLCLAMLPHLFRGAAHRDDSRLPDNRFYYLPFNKIIIIRCCKG